MKIHNDAITLTNCLVRTILIVSTAFVQRDETHSFFGEYLRLKNLTFQ
jgi:hypothetical protein